MEGSSPMAGFGFPGTWYHGRGYAGRIGSLLGQLGRLRPLVLTDEQLLSLGVVEPVLASIREAGLEVKVCGAATREPSIGLFDSMADELDLGSIDAIVAVGGGSVVDAAKGLAVIGSFGGHIKDYGGFDTVPEVPAIKVIAVPTTAGTGSEVSDGVIVIDEAAEAEFCVISRKVTPAAAVTDPLMTVSMPPGVTAMTGADALAHAIESYVSKAAVPASELFALKAIELVSRNIKAAYADGQDLDAREKVQLGATMAMIAASNTKVGLGHELATPLAVLYNIPHGRAVSMTMSVALEFNTPVLGPKAEAIFQAMGFEEDGPAGLERLLSEIGLSTRLSDHGFDEADIPWIVTETLKSGRQSYNPRAFGPEDIETMVRGLI
jgi:alcohol dehydrogenase class IV